MISIDRRRFPRPAFLTLNLGSSEAATPLEPDGVQPEFRACLVALNVHMGWLVSIRRVKEKAVWPFRRTVGNGPSLHGPRGRLALRTSPDLALESETQPVS
jgi:hypothetical protein